MCLLGTDESDVPPTPVEQVEREDVQQMGLSLAGHLVELHLRVEQV